MFGLKVILQVSTGVFGHCTAEDTAAVTRTLEDLLRRLPVRAVIYGWGTREGLLDRILEVTRRHGAAAWLWLPVFADVQNPETADPMILFGTEKESFVRTCPGEAFHFICPASARNRNQLFQAYEDLTVAGAPDGVFLDRIRYPSVVRGSAYFFGCRCAVCRDRLMKAGMNPRLFMDQANWVNSLDDCLPASMEHGRYHYSDPELERISAMKRTNITETVEQICCEFHRRGIQVGVDTFAPALADLVGQDLNALLPMVDLIKPMMYFKTLAPAGIPCETAAYGKAFSERLSALWGGKIDDPLSMEKQLKSLADPKKKVCPGIEVNHIPNICEPDIISLREAFRGIRSAGCDTVVLSWNVLQARGEELREVERILAE